ncbi:TRPM8 channel-associated factor-like protein [Biomphalaria glabrata]|nr:TRPM8 channel-associated factor-like protein [Biomphalaria glabrata]
MFIFTGPLVEGSFNIMDDIIRDDRTRLKYFIYESLAIIKSSLAAQAETAVNKIVTEQMKNDVSFAYNRYQNHISTFDKLSSKVPSDKVIISEQVVTDQQPAPAQIQTTAIISSDNEALKLKQTPTSSSSGSKDKTRILDSQSSQAQKRKQKAPSMKKASS